MKNINGMKSRKFTLIELLIVIGIIALLAAMLFPAIGSVRAQAKKVKARAAMASLKMAITQYEAQYGVLPVQFGTSDATSDIETWSSTASSVNETLKSAKYADLIAILSQVDYPAIGANAAGTASDGNPRKTRFLSVDSKYATEGYVDPWGNEFIIGIDANYDGGVVKFAGSTSTTPLNGKVFIYSKGDNDGQDDGGDKQKDVLSWD